jgi:SpoVK/Ycf46/Vps4 family AAA+-type ATPase
MNKKALPDIIDMDLIVLEYDIGKYGTAYINIGSKIVQKFFDSGMLFAQYGKRTLLVFDEADALLASRTEHSGHAEDKKILETIMKNVQTAHDTPNLYITFITNLPDVCDTASLRAGRIDKRYKFNLPTIQERSSAFRSFAEKVNNLAGYSVVRTYNPDILAELSEGFSYADIQQCVQDAVKLRSIEIARERVDKVIPAGYVTHNRLESAVKNHKGNFYKRTAIGF